MIPRSLLAWIRRRESELPLLLAALAVLAGLWGFAELASEVVEGDSRAFDEWVLRTLRDPADPGRARGPAWLVAAALDVTALGGVAVLTLVSSAATGFVLLLSLFQVLLGGWVSTNYAVLACSDFPRCQGQWWPPMDFDHGFTILRGLGEASDGGALPFAALTAIHVAHRIGAVVLLCAIGWLVWRLLHYAPQEPRLRRYATGLLAVALWQVASGISNVVLGWPLLAALAHTSGAAALIVVLTTLLAQAWHWRARLARLSVAVSAAAASRAAQ